MDIEELRKVILQPEEGSKLDFKIEPYKLNEPKPDNPKNLQEWKDNKEQAWAELTKDILALANGNIGTATQTAYLIIGADDKLKPDGTPHLRDVGDMMPSRKEILNKVNSYCKPPLPNIDCDYLTPLDSKRLFIISIPPSPYLHSLSRQLKTPKKEYSPHTVLIRRGDGEQTYEASPSEQDAILNEKKLTLNNSNSQKSEPRERSHPLDFEVYEKKIEVYRSTRKFIASVLIEGTITAEKLAEFSQNTDEALFLFDKRVADYLQELYKKAVKLYLSNRRISSSLLPIGEERSKLSEENSDLLMWFTEQLEVVRNLFYEYISL